MAAPLIVLSDLHLSPEASAGTLRALAAVVRAHPGHEIVLNGDVFGLSSDPPQRDPVASVVAVLGAEPEVPAALRAHLASGSRLTLIAGNHDAALGRESMRATLLSVLELDDAAPLAIEPWFIRRGSVHIEHGHVWDPDNAPVHPLGSVRTISEPLGIQLTRRFVSPYNVWAFAHAHETTLAAGLRRAFDVFGPGAPLLVARYFATSARICAETLFERGIARERAAGEALLSQQAARAELSEDVLRELVARAPLPTHVRFRSTFLRLYYDRVLAALGLGGGVLTAALRRSSGGALLAVASGAYLHFNVKRSGSRYQNLPIRRLRDGARAVQDVTGAELVVFGHTHVPEIAPGYANAGSFGYPAAGTGPPYLVIEPTSARVELRRHG